MQYFVRKPWDLPQRCITEEAIYRHRRQHRREFLASLGRAVGGLALTSGLGAGCAPSKPPVEVVDAAGEVPIPVAAASVDNPIYPAQRNPDFEYGRPETDRHEAAIYTNFYEFTGPTSKAAYQYVNDFRPTPWSVVVDGACQTPTTFDLDDLYRQFTFEERAYRHRCVETWAMCVPWTGFPLADLLAKVSPSASAKFVRFETFHRPDEARYVALDNSYPWPYTEGLTLAEAINPLTFIATGIYGKPMPKQHGAPVRLVLPWKYGFKSIKSIVRITLTEEAPATFWNTVSPREYDFEANVNPEIPHPRWSQRTEWMLGTRERYPTEKYNGYGDYVAALYPS
jgi:methionine sulfoxide reductase catalytic subunit